MISQMLSQQNSLLKKINLKERVDEIRNLIKNGGERTAVILALFPIIGEACRRTLNLIPFTEQIICAIALSEGSILQMNTGEGKTLAAVFAASYRALCGENVHVFTANEYLAHRDAEWMAPVYNTLGLSVASIGESMSPDSKRTGYNSQVCYLTVRQAGFDFLQDSLTWNPQKRIQQPFNFCLVDEADFIMIDEARTPLIIAGANEEFRPDPYKIRDILPALKPNVDFTEDKAQRNCNLTLNGQKKVEQILNCGAIQNPDSSIWYAAVHVALHAEYQLHRDINYIIKDNNIAYVDEITGRVAEGRKWPDGIQSALEAKEKIKINPEGRVFNTITIQSLINLYQTKSGMTATATLAAEEFNKTYKLPTILVPPHNKSCLAELPDKICETIDEKFASIVSDIQKIHQTGQPILIGTASILESERLGELLTSKGITHQILNAKNDTKEAAIISGAGMWGAVTISTNMAGRGTDIKLGGEEAIRYKEIIQLGGLFIIGTTRFDSKRVDNQLMGRAARQGDRGICRFYVSLEDNLIIKYGMADELKDYFIDLNLGDKKAAQKISNEIARAQRIIESQHSSMRRDLAKYSELIERQRKSLFSFRESILVHLNSIGTKKRNCDIAINIPGKLLNAIEETLSKIQNDSEKDKTEQYIFCFLLKEIDLFWSDQLAWAAETREAIHLVRYASKNPIDVFIHKMADLFDTGINQVFKNTLSELRDFPTRKTQDLNGLKQAKEPSSTWTYQLNDNPFSIFGNLSLEGFTRTFAKMILFLPLLIIKNFKKMDRVK